MRETFFGWLLIAPTMVVLGLFVLFPAGQSFFLSFYAVAPFTGETFLVGWEHYADLMTSAEYRNSVKATLYFTILTVPAAILISLIIALALHANPYFRGVFRTLFMLPVGISTAMAAMLWIFLFNPTAGYINYLLSLIGIEGPNWLADPSWALLSVAIATVWKEVGFNVIFFLAGLASVPEALREAAVIDGAGPWQRFVYVVLPMISPTVFFITVVSVIHSFESFGQIHILTKGGPADSTNVLVYNLYRDAFENFRTGYASAQAVVLFAVVLAFTAVQFYIGKRRVHYQ